MIILTKFLLEISVNHMITVDKEAIISELKRRLKKKKKEQRANLTPLEDSPFIESRFALEEELKILKK